jgi:hypothetical protein
LSRVFTSAVSWSRLSDLVEPADHIADGPNHTVQTRAPHAYLRWRNANARHRDVLAAERKERARIRSEKGIRWGGRPLKAAA